jgi:hypothetical protein
LIDVVFVAQNRLEFTRCAFRHLLANTDWSLVDRLIVYDDESEDGTRDLLLTELHRLPPEIRSKSQIMFGPFGGPVAVMAHYLRSLRQSEEGRLFAKIDNDIVVPPAWLNELAHVLDRYPEGDLLGLPGGFGGRPGGNPVYKYQTAEHIGGVGLLRVDAFRGRPPLEPNGRFGFTEWQWKYGAHAAWIAPDLLCVELDRMPVGPWPALSAEYIEKGWQRDWGKYPLDHDLYWSWWRDEAEGRA